MLYKRNVSMCLALLLPIAAATYDETLAVSDIWLNQAFGCANVSSWTCGLACDMVPLTDVVLTSDAKLETAAITARLSPTQCVVAFQGSKDWLNWLEDFDFFLAPLPNCTACKVHSGFLGAWRGLEAGVRGALGALGCGSGTVAITGHSLGAALAQLAAFELAGPPATAGGAAYPLSRLYSYASPRVGDAAWAAASDARLAALAVPHYRVVLYRDLVPHLPLSNMFFQGWTHTGSEIYYNATSLGAYTHCAEAGDKRCSAQWSALQGHPCDHCSYLGMNPCDCGSTTPHCVEPAKR